MVYEISEKDKKEFLIDLVDVYSPTGEEEDIANLIKSKLREYEIKAYLDEAGNVIARKENKGPKILLTGHMDTVKGRIPLRVEEDILWGRGSVDAKGSLAALLYAFLESEGDLIFASLVEEEGSSKGAKMLDIEDPDYIIVGEPSGWQGVTIGYKGNLNMKFEEKVKRFHSSRQKDGAAEKLIEKWMELSRDFQKGFYNPTGRIKRLEAYEKEYYFEGEMIVNIRKPPDYIPDLKGEIIESVPAYEISRKNPLVRSMVRSIRECGGEPKLKKKTGTADMNILAPKFGAEAIAYGPGDSKLDHTPNEHLNLKEYFSSIQTLKLGLKKIKHYDEQ